MYKITEENVKKFLSNDFTRKQIIRLDKLFYQKKEKKTVEMILSGLTDRLFQKYYG